MLTVSLAFLLLGGALLYGGWTGKSLRQLLMGDNQTQGKTPQGNSRVPLGQGVSG